MYQIIPFKRDSWESKKINLKNNILTKVEKQRYNIKSIFLDGYKKQYWNKKIFN
jgi:hypothetical protein